MQKQHHSFAMLFFLIFFLIGCSSEKITDPIDTLDKEGKPNKEAPQKITITMADQNKTIRFMPIGDSYTHGENVKPSESFPFLLTQSLKKEGLHIELIENPAVSGYTSQNAIDLELPLFREQKPDFSTLLIGANDIVQGSSAEEFQESLNLLLDEMNSHMEGDGRIILLTIPDFSLTPYAKNFGQTNLMRSQIVAFNQILTAEAKKRNLPVVDLFRISQEMENNQTLISSDGLHPSKEEYQRWNEAILPIAKSMLASK